MDKKVKVRLSRIYVSLIGENLKLKLAEVRLG